MRCARVLEGLRGILLSALRSGFNALDAGGQVGTLPHLVIV
jgi:hypothetical protein